MNYLLLNCAVLAAVGAVLLLTRAFVVNRAVLLTLCILIVTTAVFDSIIIAAGIVGYDTSKLLGIYIGHAPIEDFFYAVLACVVVPAVWEINKGESRE